MFSLIMLNLIYDIGYVISILQACSNFHMHDKFFHAVTFNHIKCSFRATYYIKLNIGSCSDSFFIIGQNTLSKSVPCELVSETLCN